MNCGYIVFRLSLKYELRRKYIKLHKTLNVTLRIDEGNNKYKIKDLYNMFTCFHLGKQVIYEFTQKKTSRDISK